MVENDYLIQERSTHDRRSIRVRASEKGLALWQKMDEMFNRHTARMGPDTVSNEDLTTANEILARLERFWGGPMGFGGGTLYSRSVRILVFEHIAENGRASCRERVCQYV